MDKAIIRAYITKPLQYVPAPRLTDAEYQGIQQRAIDYKERLDLLEKGIAPPIDFPLRTMVESLGRVE